MIRLLLLLLALFAPSLWAADLGNDTATGPGGRSNAGELRGIQVTMSEAGTLDSITAYVDATGGHSMYAYLYDASGNLLAQSTERTDISSTAGWHTFSGFGSYSLSDATSYWIVTGADSANTANAYWESGLTYTGDTTTGFPAFTDATSPVDPATFSDDGIRDYLIYMSYTPGAAVSIPVLHHQLRNQ